MGDDDRREWSRLEIEGVFHSAMRRYEEKLDGLIENNRDANQASLLTAALLAGNDAMGLKGFIPETREHFEALDKNWAVSFETTSAMKVAVEDIKARQGRIEAGQHRIRRRLKELYESATQSGDGKWDYTKIAALTGLGAAGFAWVHPHLAGWVNALKRVVGF